MKEYAAVKAFRAWTYLQLALVYEKVPFVTEPITSMEQISIPRLRLWFSNGSLPPSGNVTPNIFW